VPKRCSMRATNLLTAEGVMPQAQRLLAFLEGK
jgi:hypothetical protein